MRCIQIFLLLSLTPFLLTSQIIFQTPLSLRNANYKINVKFDPDLKILDGTETISWKNLTSDEIKELQFHLYWNAFKNNFTTFLTESKGISRGQEITLDACGWIDIILMKVKGGEDLTKKIQFISPDDNNMNDQTVFKVPLLNTIKPFGNLELEIVFKSRIPKIFARAGFNKDFFMIAQWFPKIGVYEKKDENSTGNWNCHQYHKTTEYFADYGIYDVTITAPEKFIIGSTGIKLNETINTDKTKTSVIRAEDVHDFSWCAYPYFLEKNDQWKNVKIRLLYPEDRESLSERHISSVKYAFNYLDSIVGKYPYPNLTIIDPPDFADGASGMEYPTLITTASLWGFNYLANVPEMVTIHEFIHQYFYGILGSNEFEEAWLDEGFTQYMESRVMNATYGDNTSLMNKFGIQIGNFEISRAQYTSSNLKIDFSAQKSYMFKAGGSGNFIYMKPAVFLTTLQRLLSDEIMNKILSTYFLRWQFKHPTSADFINIVNEVLKKESKTDFDVKFFFEQVLYGTNVCDYAFYRVFNERQKERIGYFDKDTNKIAYTGSIKDSSDFLKRYNNTLIVQRLGEIILPVDVKITFDNGDIKYEKWDGKDRYRVFKYNTNSKIIEAEIDPENKIPLDVNIINNSYIGNAVLNGIWRYILQFLDIVQNFLQTIIIFA